MSQKNTFLIDTMAKKDRDMNSALKKREDEYFHEIIKTFDFNDRRFFPSVVKFTVENVASNSVVISQLIGSAITGPVRMDLCINLISKLFTDISKETLQQVIQHTYDLSYIKQGDTRTIQLLENKLIEINESNIQELKKTTTQTHKSRKGCFGKRSQK
jgi:hypothetical protein